MRFSQSTHLLMFLSLETLTSIIRTDCYNFSISNDLTQMVNFPTWIPDCDSHSPALLDISILLTLLFVLQWFSLDWEIPIMLLSQFPLTFQTHKRVPHFITWLMTILMLLGTVFLMIWEKFHGRMSLKSVLVLLLVNL